MRAHFVRLAGKNQQETHVHGGVDLGHGLVVRGELVDLHPVADQLAGDFDLELGQLALGNGVGFGDDWNDVDLITKRNTGDVEATGETEKTHKAKYLKCTCLHAEQLGGDQVCCKSKYRNRVKTEQTKHMPIKLFQSVDIGLLHTNKQADIPARIPSLTGHNFSYPNLIIVLIALQNFYKVMQNNKLFLHVPHIKSKPLPTV